MTRSNHSHEAVPAEIVAEGSSPTSADPAEVFVVDADPTEPGAQPGPEAASVESADIGPAEAPLPTELDPDALRNLVEALVFAADKPISLQRLRQLTRVTELASLEQALADLAQHYQNRGIALHEVSGGYQFRTHTAFSPWVQQLIAGRPVRLSRAQLETLAIIAYRQPITRPEIDDIRGVDSSATLRLLLDRSLVRILGKREEVGRPMLYGTTKEFLEFFSLTDLRELPTLREYSELTAESRKVVSDRLGSAEALGAMGSAVMGASGVGESSGVAEPVAATDASYSVAPDAVDVPETDQASDATATSDAADALDAEDALDATGNAEDTSSVVEASDADASEAIAVSDAMDTADASSSSNVADLAGTFPAGGIRDDASGEIDDESNEIYDESNEIDNESSE